MYIVDHEYPVIYPFIDTPRNVVLTPCIVVYEDYSCLEGIESPLTLSPVQTTQLIDAMQTAAKIQQMLVAGEPIVIVDGQLVENLVPQSATLPLRDSIVLGWIAANKFIAIDERTNDIDVMEAIQHLIDAGLYRDGLLTDLGWMLVKAGR